MARGPARPVQARPDPHNVTPVASAAGRNNPEPEPGPMTAS
ncbi:hypothetical protein [Catenulispora pinistramenti]|nr:hypothetical protein [Catenulispora pinistramenti]